MPARDACLHLQFTDLLFDPNCRLALALAPAAPQSFSIEESTSDDEAYTLENGKGMGSFHKEDRSASAVQQILFRYHSSHLRCPILNVNTRPSLPIIPPPPPPRS
uniref:Uncharacterized protein n=1 Tax=Mycena chlorophos TaxID=658473 RepID=A0ABQ0L2M4_MYCCL|nr:predicted protein [Mycena chlorophos]